MKYRKVENRLTVDLLRRNASASSTNSSRLCQRRERVALAELRWSYIILYTLFNGNVCVMQVQMYLMSSCLDTYVTWFHTVTFT
jgi:hypothetical protein